MSSLERFAESQTISHLRSGPSAERLARLVATIEVKADTEIEEAHRAGPRVHCRAGCSHCCHQFVTAVIPEVLALAERIRTTYSCERFTQLSARIESYLEEVRTVPGPKRVGTLRRPCPVLENDLCGAFEARPIACRAHNSIDADECARYISGERKQPALANSRQTQVGNGLLAGMALGIRGSRLQEALVEFIPALDIALRTLDATERYLAGEPLFDSVIVSGYDPSVIRRALKKRSQLGIPMDT